MTPQFDHRKVQESLLDFWTTDESELEFDILDEDDYKAVAEEVEAIKQHARAAMQADDLHV